MSAVLADPFITRFDELLPLLYIASSLAIIMIEGSHRLLEHMQSLSPQVEQRAQDDLLRALR